MQENTNTHSIPVHKRQTQTPGFSHIHSRSRLYDSLHTTDIHPAVGNFLPMNEMKLTIIESGRQILSFKAGSYSLRKYFLILTSVLMAKRERTLIYS